MFESKLLDKVSRVHPSVPLFIFVPAIVVFAWAGFARLAVPETIALIAGGYLFWTLTEYWLHRLVFHFEPEGRFGARLHWIIHGVHHDHPNDPMRLVMPPSLSVPTESRCRADRRMRDCSRSTCDASAFGRRSSTRAENSIAIMFAALRPRGASVRSR